MRGIGALLLMGAFLLSGVLSVRSRCARIRCLHELGEAFVWMAGELAGKKLPIPELIRSCSLMANGYARSFYLQLEQSLSQLGSRSFFELWKEAVAQLPWLTEGERRELDIPGRELGRAELSRQLAALETAVRFLRTSYEHEESRFQNDRKLCLGLPAAAGVLLLILLL